MGINVNEIYVVGYGEGSGTFERIIENERERLHEALRFGHFAGRWRLRMLEEKEWFVREV